MRTSLVWWRIFPHEQTSLLVMRPVYQLNQQESYLSAVNLHDRCPSSISTSKISHVAENGDCFGVQAEGYQFTDIRAIRTILKGTGEGLEGRSMDITSFLTVDICLSGSYYVDSLSKACNLPI